MPFSLTSKAFGDGREIPAAYGKNRTGKDASPPLAWTDPPAGAKSFALIVEDVDAPIVGLIPHWVLYNIPRDKRELPEGLPGQESFPDGTIQGRNFFRRHAYMGPSPPFGTHRYFFRLYALDTVLTPDPGMNRKKLLKAMDEHILGQARLVGMYARK